MSKKAKQKYRGRLRIRIFIFGILVLLAVAVFAWAGTYTVVSDRSARLEATYTGDAARRAQAAVDDELYRLQARTADLAAWDDTYAFMQLQSPDYPEVNLDTEAFIRYGVNIIVLADTAGNIVFSKAFDLNRLQEIEAGLDEHLVPGSPLLSLDASNTPVTGLVLLADYPLLVSAQPILTSTGGGPSRGVLVMGRFLDESVSSQREGLLQMALSVTGAKSIRLPADFWSLAAENPIVVDPLDSSKVAGYAPISDIYGDKSIILRVELPRDIYNESIRSAQFLSIGFIVLIAICLIFVVVIFDRRVLRRLSRIDTFVRDYRTGETFSPARVGVTGNDELARMAVSINGMIDRLEESKQQLQLTAHENFELSEKNRQQYEEEKKVRQALQEEIEKRMEFTRGLVHELKTPITPIMASVDLLQSQLEDQRLLDLTNIVKRSADNLGERINTLLDFARAEINMLQLEVSMLEPLLILEETGRTMKPVAEKNRQTMVIELPNSLPIIYTDAKRLRHVIESLLSNAFKFTPAGGTITLTARDENGVLNVEVHDTGMGIALEDQEWLFEPYRRRTGDQERLSGLGVGLALSKKFVEMQGGTIWVKSEKGKGSTFGFSLPANSPHDKMPGVKEKLK